MSKATWGRGVRYCEATNKDGTPCGNKVACLPSGVIIHRYCGTHRRARARASRLDAGDKA